MSYIVADEYDWTGPYKNRTDATKECKRWRLEGRNAEVVRRIPKHLEAKGATIMPRFYERSADQVFNHSQPIDVGGDRHDRRDHDGPCCSEYDDGPKRWYERSLDDWDAPVYEQPRLRGWLEREPDLESDEVCAKCGHTRWTALHVQPWGALGHVFELAMSPQELIEEHTGRRYQ